MPENILEHLKEQYAGFIQQRELAQNNFNQLIGAIYACELMIKKHEEELKSQSGEPHVEIINQDSQQVTEE